MSGRRLPGQTPRRAGTAGAKGGKDTRNALRIEGLSQLRRDLRKIDRDLEREINLYVRKFTARLVEHSKLRAPLDSGALRKSIRGSVTQKTFSLYSRLPYAPAQEWGTVPGPSSRVKPKGVPIPIRRRQFLGYTVFRNRQEFEDHIMDLVPTLARKNGFDD